MEERLTGEICWRRVFVGLRWEKAGLERKDWLGGDPERLAQEGDSACPEGERRVGQGLTRG